MIILRLNLFPNNLRFGVGREILIIASSRPISEAVEIICCQLLLSENDCQIDNGQKNVGRLEVGISQIHSCAKAIIFFLPVLQTIKDISAHIISLKRAYHNAPPICTKRDINAATRQILLRPDARALFSTEFRGHHMGLDLDIAIGYIVLPFGWAGAPGIFASVAKLIPRYRTLTCPSNSLWNGVGTLEVTYFRNAVF